MFKKILPISLLVLASCASTVTFPVSDVVPAATFTVKKKIDKHKNYIIEIDAKNLASPDRINPSGNNYSVWIETPHDAVLNVGQLNVKNGQETSLKTITPYDFDAVFITVEKEGNLQRPAGREISRTKI